MLLKDIILNPALQSRANLSQETIDEYYEVLKEGGELPPITVYRVGSRYYVVDGWHRVYAHKKAGLADIQVEVLDGTMREATLYAISANDGHGLRRSNDDKRKAVMMLLDDMEWSEWSDREVAKAAKVSHVFVSKLRNSLGLVKEEVKAVVKGKETTVKVNRSEENHPEPQEFKEELSQEIAAIVEENENLTRRLAVAAMEATDEEKRLAEDQLMEMSAQIKTLEATNTALTARLNTEMNKASEMGAQIKYWKRRAEKAEKKLEEFAKLGVAV
jgi:ParB-like chromosome segregation protein Spo0J